ncbi:MAG: endonuclease MutS2 [Thermincolia bacterium]
MLKRLEYDKVIEMLVDCAGSMLGKEIAAQLNPSIDLEEVKPLQEETKEAKEILRFYPDLPLGGIRDIRGILRKVEIGGVLEPTELLEVADTVLASRRLKTFLVEAKGTYPILKDLASFLGLYRQLEDQVGRCIMGNGEVETHASDKLASIRSQVKTNQNRVKDRLDNVLRSTEYQKMLQENLITMRGDRYVVPVKHEYRGQFGGIVHDQSASGATLYIEPVAVVEINNDLRRLLVAEKQEIVRILTQLTNLVRASLEEIKETTQLLGQLDFVFAKAFLSQRMDAVEPRLNQGGKLNVIKGRHPLLKGDVVPVSIHLGDEFDILIITGPNTGGKTVTLKTVGLFSLMAQAGLQVPAEVGTELTVFSQVFSDIGDEQSIEQSLSTFSSHMTNIISILEKADANSLVLMDELGSGTDPTEGAALAMAILDEFHIRGTKVIATTHYSELKTFAYRQERMENASVEFNIETLRPTYRLLIGQPGRSNAFEISARLGLPRTIVDRAKSHLSQEAVEVADLIENLEANQRVAEREKEEAIRLRCEVARMKVEYQHIKEEFDNKKARILEKANDDAYRITQEARHEAEGVIKELKEAMATEAEKGKLQAMQEAREKLKLLHGKAAQRAERQAKNAPGQAPRQVKVGQEVFIPKINQKGHIISLPGDNGEAQVQVGIMKINMVLEDLRIVAQETKATEKTGAGRLMMNKSASIANEIDLRGMTVDEATLEVEKYLDDAYLSGLPQAYLIHGKGTGALRAAIKDLLAKHPHVKSSRIGAYGEGGTGVTVVELK